VGRGKKQAALAFAFLSLDILQMQEAPAAKHTLRIVILTIASLVFNGAGCETAHRRLR
jgi:hypothetical protein